MLKFFRKKEKEKELITVEDYLDIIKEKPLKPDSTEFNMVKSWVDSQILPKLCNLVCSPVDYVLSIPTYEEIMDECTCGWEITDETYGLDKGFYYFWVLFNIEPEECVIVLDLIIQVLVYYGYKVTWKCSGRNIIFTISLP